ncbi:MAG: GGDEF domain-containing protein, partial [Candidatus Latescibacteria bacterium]|nr:GGDEF domain-containing protein [Candidatus Latescibacterota bacterium]
APKEVPMDDHVKTVLEEEVRYILAAYGTAGNVRKGLDRLLENRDDAIYARMLWLMASLRMDSVGAKGLWKQVVDHREEMAEKFGRSVRLGVALHDWLLADGSFLKVAKLVDMERFDRISRSAVTDGLTGIYNASFLRKSLVYELDRVRRYGGTFSIVFYDLDDFKAFNDTHGRLAGDAALRQFGLVLARSKRSTDIPGRYGGEEFLLIFPGVDYGAALEAAERIRAIVETTDIDVGGEHLRITVSGGVATYPEDGDTPADLIACADRALYRAKGTGKNRIYGCREKI